MWQETAFSTSLGPWAANALVNDYSISALDSLTSASRRRSARNSALFGPIGGHLTKHVNRPDDCVIEMGLVRHSSSPILHHSADMSLHLHNQGPPGPPSTANLFTPSNSPSDDYQLPPLLADRLARLVKVTAARQSTPLPAFDLGLTEPVSPRVPLARPDWLPELSLEEKAAFVMEGISKSYWSAPQEALYLLMLSPEGGAGLRQ